MRDEPDPHYPLPAESALEECGARDGSALVLERRGAVPRTPGSRTSDTGSQTVRASRDSGPRGTKPHEAKPAREKRPANATGRALSERTARTLPRS